MPLQNSSTGQRGRNDLLLQKIPDGEVAYRMVLSDPPAETDFRSHYELGLRPNPTSHYKAFDWFGVSLFLDRSKVERMVDTARGRGDDAWVARLRLASGAGLYGVYNAKTTHLEVFGLPQDLLNRVDNTP